MNVLLLEWIAQKIPQNAENHIFEVLDFQIFLRRIDRPPPLPAMCVTLVICIGQKNP